MISSSDVVHAINWSWSGLLFLSWWHTSILFIWPFFALIIGFSNGTFLHIVPIAYEIFILKMISVAISGFGVEMVGPKEATIKHQTIILSIVALVIGIAFNVAHSIYTLVVTFQDSLIIDSTLYWFLIVFSILLLVLTILEAILIYYLVKLKQHLGLLAKVK